MGLTEYNKARKAAQKAGKAKNNAGKDRKAINQAVNTIKPAQQECQTYISVAQDAFLTL